MLARIVLKRRGKQDGESPFWISFSDLMSALMVLFLVVMAVTLVAVTQSIDSTTKASIERDAAINKLMTMIADSSQKSGVGVDQKNFRIDLGKEVRFESGSFVISPAARQFLRAYVPVLLNAKNTPEGERWMRSVVIEGFTDEEGTYLYNLQLSLDRSRSVVCALFEGATAGEVLSRDQLERVQELFLVGGYSFNSTKKDKAESRRVEFKVDFWGLGETPTKPSDVLKGKDFGRC